MRYWAMALYCLRKNKQTQKNAKMLTATKYVLGQLMPVYFEMVPISYSFYTCGSTAVTRT